jgi:hypothetical protein
MALAAVPSGEKGNGSMVRLTMKGMMPSRAMERPVFLLGE